jgi:AraC-like DNA-binding protein
MHVDEYAQARPSPALRPYIAFYSGYRQRGVAPALHRGLPSPYLTLILTLDDPLVIAAHPDRRQRPGRYDALIGGLHLAPALITHDGNQSGVQVAVHPLGCRALFGLPAGELASLDTDFGAVSGDGFVGALRERLREAVTWSHRFALLDDAMAGLIRDRAAVHPDVAYAFDRLVDSGGEVTIGDLAGEIGWSPRHLTNRFRAEVGLRPKETARVVRFDRARRLLHTGARLGDVAAKGGYFDQAHLSREFHALAGVSPTRWMADEIGFVQAARAARGHDEWHD